LSPLFLRSVARGPQCETRFRDQFELVFIVDCVFIVRGYHSLSLGAKPAVCIKGEDKRGC
jgi:hypothetical protein